MNEIVSQYYNTCLAHHGIKGQKWGVRRFQNPDGTLTTIGKLRKRNDFYNTEQEVIKKCSNTAQPFKKSSIDISTIKSRAAVDDKDAYALASLANKKFDEASKVEPRITKDIIDAVSKADCKMYGLEYRLKQPTSMAGKIGSDAKEKGISFKEASDSIKDSVRYTAVSDTNDFVKNYETINKNLESNGYSATKIKNYFEKYRAGEVMHKSVQCTYKDKNGFEFEVQFQTPASQAAKELKIPIYEERRKSDISPKRAAELEKEMRDLAEQVEYPPDIEKIK